MQPSSTSATHRVLPLGKWPILVAAVLLALLAAYLLYGYDNKNDTSAVPAPTTAITAPTITAPTIPASTLPAASELIPETQVLLPTAGWTVILVRASVPLPADTESHVLVIYNLKSPAEESLEVIATDLDNSQLELTQRELHPDAEAIRGDGFEGIVYGGDGSEDPGAVLQTDEAIYALRLPRATATSTRATIDQVRELVATMSLRDAGPIYERLGLQSRANLYRQWITETPLPPGADLTWTFDGPPTTAQLESLRALQIFSCTWAGYWVETGNPASLNELVAAGDWPMAHPFGFDGPIGIPDASLEEARTLTDADARQQSRVARDCGWLLEPTAGD